MIEQYFGDYLPKLRIDRNELLGLGRQNPRDEQRAVRHDRAGPPAGQRHQRRQQAARQRVAEDVEGHLAGAARERECRSRRSPTASTRRAGCRRKSASSTTATSACSGKRGRPTSRSGSASSTSPTPNCGARTNAAANGWSPSPAGGSKTSSSAAARRPAEVDRADEVLDPEALTIGFARRFATYKRGTCIFRNLERLAAHRQQQGSAGAVHLRRQGPPAGPRRQGTDRRDRRRSPAGPSSAAASSSSKTTT